MMEFPENQSARPAVDIRSLSVDYGDLVAVSDLTLSIPQGEVCGFLGPHGAGKTSIFKVIGGLMKPRQGEVLIDGGDILGDAERIVRVTAYLPDLVPMPSNLKVGEYLETRASGLVTEKSSEPLERVPACLENTGLAQLRETCCNTLSRGQWQRVLIAENLLRDPRILMLDELASGLDAHAREEMSLVLNRIAQSGITVLVSSSVLEEIADMCTSLCVMKHGKLLTFGTLAEVREALESNKRTITVTLLSRLEEAAVWLGARAVVSDLTIKGNQLIFSFTGSEDAQADLLEGMVDLGMRIRTYEEKASRNATSRRITEIDRIQ
ncbi:ABC transporter ATP-binding protein [Luteolibacter algae]|uniref:ABC transporter ATP-binding protein n=1 Tax=Luteolibacter algae TaxID=454151 RepID=A0ABW5D5H1_9BACT